MKIVDLTAGTRSIWFNKTQPGVIFLDIRSAVEPTFVVDARKTALADKHFDMVVFDPPHANFSKNGKMSKNYGHHTAAEIRELLIGAAKEAHRISKPTAFMAFKWNDHDLKLDSALKHLSPYWEPLFGQKTSVRTMRVSTTYWVMLKRNTFSGPAIREALMKSRAEGNHIGRKQKTDYAKVYELRNKGMSTQKIADQLGCSRGSVQHALRLERQPK